MPNRFQLFLRETGEPESLIMTDKRICEYLGMEVHPVKYVHNWYTVIGLQLACGLSFDQIRGNLEDDSPLIGVVNFLQHHYTVDAWYSPFK